MQNKWFKWEISIVLEGEKTRKNRTWCYTIFKYLSHYGFKSTWYLLKTISKIQNHSINYFKRRVMRHFFRKYCYVKIFLHFGIIQLYNNYIGKKAWKTFNSSKMQILLVYKYNKTRNRNSKTTKRKSLISSLLESLSRLFRGPFWCVEVCFEVFEIWCVSTHTYVISENIPKPS